MVALSLVLAVDHSQVVDMVADMDIVDIVADMVVDMAVVVEPQNILDRGWKTLPFNHHLPSLHIIL